MWNIYFPSFVTDSSSKKCLVSSLECLSSIVERISTDPTVGAPMGDSVVPRGPGSPQSSPAGIYEPLWTDCFFKRTDQSWSPVQLPHRRLNRGPFSTPVNNELSRGRAQTQRMLGLSCHMFVFMSEWYFNKWIFILWTEFNPDIHLN